MLKRLAFVKKAAGWSPKGPTMDKLILSTQQYMVTGPDVINLFSCLAQFSMKFFLRINFKMPTIYALENLHSRLI